MFYLSVLSSSFYGYHPPFFTDIQYASVLFFLQAFTIFISIFRIFPFFLYLAAVSSFDISVAVHSQIQLYINYHKQISTMKPTSQSFPKTSTALSLSKLPQYQSLNNHTTPQNSATTAKRGKNYNYI